MIQNLVRRAFFHKSKNNNLLTDKFAQQHETYNNLFEAYKKDPNNVDPHLFRKVLQSANPKLMRNPAYHFRFKQILKNGYPHFRENIQFYKKQNILDGIAILYQSMNIHRKDIFNLFEEVLTQNGKINFNSLLISSAHHIYKSMVQLHHIENTLLKQGLINIISQKLFYKKYANQEDQQILVRKFQRTGKILKSFLLDPTLNEQFCMKTIVLLQKFADKIKTVDFSIGVIAKNFAFIHESLKLRNIKVRSSNFKKILEAASHSDLSTKLQSHKKYISNKVERINLESEQLQDQIERQEQKNKKKNQNRILFGMNSVFQTIFAKQLRKLGYQFDRNVLIGNFQYDFVVKGKCLRPYLPFQRLNTTDPNPIIHPISSQQWQTYLQMTDLKNLKINQPFPNKVVLNLNGPTHYIDSDVYGMTRVSRTEEIAQLFVKNYGYSHFNIVYYKTWEEIHQGQIGIKKEIQRILATNIFTSEILTSHSHTNLLAKDKNVLVSDTNAFLNEYSQSKSKILNNQVKVSN